MTGTHRGEWPPGALAALMEIGVVGHFGFGGRAILPAAGFQPALAALKAAAAKIGRPPNPN